MPRKRFGQHFLIDQEVIDRIHVLIALKETDHVLEIGPGRGELTRGLIASGANIVAVEIDTHLAANLRVKYSSVAVISGDALELAEKLFRRKRIVGNLPYEISTPFLLKLFSTPDIVDMHFMLQREVVERLTAVPATKDWGRLSVKAQQRWVVHRCLDVAPEAFWPSPQVDSSFVRIAPRSDPSFVKNQTVFDDVIRRAFGQRRKKISNSLVQLNVEWEQLGIDQSLRADQLTVGQYVTIANSLNQ